MADENAKVSSDVEPTVGDVVAHEGAHPQENDVVSFKREDATSGRLTKDGAEFVAYAKETIDDGESEAIFNAALDFAQHRVIDAAAMGDVLAELFRRKQLPLAVLRMWLREGRDALGESEVANGADVVINTRVHEHGSRSDWVHAEILKTLGNWQTIFNSELFGRTLPPAAISIARSRRSNLGWYLLVRDGLGLRYRINLNELYITRPLSLTLETLLHEMVHLWEDVVHGRRKGGQYHSKLFREKAAELGIPSDPRGCSIGADPHGRFAQLLRRHGVLLDGVSTSSAVRPDPITQVRSPGSRLAKWSCGCTNVRVSSGIELAATCLRCDRDFARQP